ncbi:MAG: hypothetical protein ABIE07_13905 [Candidatus Zixiibacteriota bacterium]
MKGSSMPFCPKCKYEYEWGIGECPDCEAKLVDSLPVKDEENELDYDNWTPLVRLLSDQLAYMVIEGLKAKDIPVVMISGAGHFGATGQMGISSSRSVGGGYTILVPEEFIEDAMHEGEVILGDDWNKARFIDIN